MSDAPGELTPRMKRLHAKLTDAPQLAFDIAQAAEVGVHGAAGALAALERRGMAGRERGEDGKLRWYRAELPQ